MQTNVQEFYTQNVLPMNEQERLRLAALIIGDLSNGQEFKAIDQNQSRKKSSIRELFGKGRSGDPTGADNEKIDVDLARQYGSTHEDED